MNISRIGTFRRVFGFIIIFTLINGAIIPFVHADDGGPNTLFWVTDQKVNCVSVTNLEVLSTGAFLVFDYSAKVGESLGKPWTIVEKGKCYEMEDGSEDIYVVKVVTGKEHETFSNYSLYKSTDSVREIFCKNNDCTLPGSLIKPTYFFGAHSVTTSGSDVIHFTGITADALFPTKYMFGYPVTSVTSIPVNDALDPIIKSTAFVQASTLYTSLAKQLVSALNSCDTRVRIERQYSLTETDFLGIYIKNVIWRLANNEDVLVQTAAQIPTSYALSKTDILNQINLMGCKNTFSTFVKTHADDWSAIDKNVEAVIAEYPEALTSNGIDATIRLRDTVELSNILAFANDQALAPKTIEISELPETIIVTELDEPTPEKKTEIVMESENPLTKIYTILPILALVGLIVFLIAKKRQK